MKVTRKLAEKVFDELTKNGIELGNASIGIIAKVLDNQFSNLKRFDLSHSDNGEFIETEFIESIDGQVIKSEDFDKLIGCQK